MRVVALLPVSFLMHMMVLKLCMDNPHLERRRKGESNEDVAHKARYALDKGLLVMACCGKLKESQEVGTINDFLFPHF